MPLRSRYGRYGTTGNSSPRVLPSVCGRLPTPPADPSASPLQRSPPRAVAEHDIDSTAPAVDRGSPSTAFRLHTALEPSTPPPQNASARGDRTSPPTREPPVPQPKSVPPAYSPASLRDAPNGMTGRESSPARPSPASSDATAPSCLAAAQHREPPHRSTSRDSESSHPSTGVLNCALRW